jgi:hypothetical protein
VAHGRRYHGIGSQPLFLSDLSFVIRSQTIVDGLRRTWREMYVCRSGEGYCSRKSHDQAGDWRVGKEPVLQERWHFADGRWSVDVELGSGISYAEAETIILAIRRRSLRTKQSEWKERIQAYDASSITAIRVIDPLAHKFTVDIDHGYSGYRLVVGLQDGAVHLDSVETWRA